MDLQGARVLLVADDPMTLDRLHGYLSRARARPQIKSRTTGLSAAASGCDVAVLFDDYGEPDEFDACLVTLSRSKAALIIVTERASLQENAPRARIVLARSRLVRGWCLLDAIRLRVSMSTGPVLGDSTPELPFTD
jgi:hypothetical protein